MKGSARAARRRSGVLLGRGGATGGLVLDELLDVSEAVAELGTSSRVFEVGARVRPWSMSGTLTPELG